MGFFGSAYRAVQVGFEYKAAITAAQDAYAAGKSLPDVVRAFTDNTDGTYDDAAADLLEKELRQGIEWAHQAATIAGKVAAAIEDNGPAVFAAAAKTLFWINEHAEDVRAAAAKTGVAAVKLSTRLEALLR
jgi:hypothetical protein